MQDYNDLATLKPELAAEWDYEKNILKPTEVTVYSSRKAWWLCGKCGRSWEAMIASRSKGGGCTCERGSKHAAALRKTKLEHVGSFADKNPEIAKEWHSLKNGTLTPYDVTPSSAQKAYWICSVCNYEWESCIYSRNKGHGCSKCRRKESILNRIQKNGSLADKNPELAA